VPNEQPPRTSTDYLKGIGDYRTLALVRMARGDPWKWYSRAERDALTDDEVRRIALVPDPLEHELPPEVERVNGHELDDVRVRSRAIGEVERTRVQWLWRGWLPRGKLVMFEGDPKLGKSTITLAIAAALTTTSPLPDGQRNLERVNVLLASAEDDAGDTIRPRLEAHGADLDRVRVIEGVVDRAGDDDELELPAYITALEAHVIEHNAGLVVIDPVFAYLASGVDSYRDQDVRRVLARLKLVAERTSSCIVLVRHLRKDHGAKAIYAGGGSIGWAAACRVLLTVGTMQDKRTVLVRTGANIGTDVRGLPYSLVEDVELEVARVQWHEPIDIDPNEVVAQHRTSDREDDRRNATRDAHEWLIDAMPVDGSEVLSRDLYRLAQHEGISKTTLKKAKQALGIVHRREGEGKEHRTFWRYPREARASLSPNLVAPRNFGPSGTETMPDAATGAGLHSAQTHSAQVAFELLGPSEMPDSPSDDEVPNDEYETNDW